MMFLSLLTLNPLSRRVQHRHRTGYQTHRSILTAFPMPLPPDERVLFRREDQTDPPAIRLLVQSLGEPDWRLFTDDHLDGMLCPPQVKPYNPQFFVGQVLAFRLLANPTVKREGHRLGLFREDDQILWLARKGETGGFVVDPAGVRVQKKGFVRGSKPRGASDQPAGRAVRRGVAGHQRRPLLANPAIWYWFSQRAGVWAALSGPYKLRF